jgi:signal transduction histidine kinase
MTRLPVPRRMRRSSVRTRIAAACAGLFLVLGGILIAATYGLVGHFSQQAAHGKVTSVPWQGTARLYAQCLDEHGSGRGAPAPQAASRCHQEVRASFLAGATQQGSNDRRGYLVFSLAGLGLATVLAGGLGWALSTRVLRPLRAITEAARAASQENLDQRLALTGPPDELKELADTFDEMLTRLDAAFASQRRFVANASHELRTPLTEMRTLIDVTLAKPATPPRQIEPVLASIRAAVDKSEELIEALLTLARSDRGLGHSEIVHLPTAVEDAIDQISAAAAAKQIRIETALQDTQITGDRVLLERLATNLIDNAVRHNQPGGWVHASIRQAAGVAVLTVASSGQPIPPDQVPGLFEPFRRLGGRAGTRTGTGLGLSIVESVARAHGGQADARARPEGGLEVQVRLSARTHGDTHTPALTGSVA